MFVLHFFLGILSKNVIAIAVTALISDPPSVPKGPRRQPGEDDTGSGSSCGHVCVAGPRLCDHPGLHH